MLLRRHAFLAALTAWDAGAATPAQIAREECNAGKKKTMPNNGCKRDYGASNTQS
jgi:hypothetical protein